MQGLALRVRYVPLVLVVAHVDIHVAYRDESLLLLPVLDQVALFEDVDDGVSVCVVSDLLSRSLRLRLDALHRVLQELLIVFVGINTLTDVSARER